MYTVKISFNYLEGSMLSAHANEMCSLSFVCVNHFFLIK